MLSITLRRVYQAIHMVRGVMLLNFVLFDQACHFLTHYDQILDEKHVIL